MLTENTITENLPPKVERVFVAYSGGVDSHVLLHLVGLCPSLTSKITAVYVHHGLQAEADDWAKHCEAISKYLDVPFLCLKVDAKKSVGQSQEEVARNVRYDALKGLLQAEDVLLVAQHQEDQLETVLLQLFRGAGVQGLSGMPSSIEFGLGVMCRPFLDISKQVINEYAAQYRLHWIEDPSNLSDAFDRNYLRNQILPLLKQRWPRLDKTVSRSARHCAATHKLLNEMAEVEFERIYDIADKTLNIKLLAELELAKQHLVLRRWFTVNALRMPSEKLLQRIVVEVLAARQDANPNVQGTGFSIRRYRNKLFCLRYADIDGEISSEVTWPKELGYVRLSGVGVLSLCESGEGLSKNVWMNADVLIKYRQGAEKLKLAGRTGHHSLKKLFQEQGIPPWVRNKIPLVYLNGQLAVVAGLWISADFVSKEKDSCYQIVWKQE